jgi:hypothetical protein
MENNQIVLNDKRICYKIILLSNSIFLLYNIISILLSLKYIEKNKLFYHYIITLFTIFLSTSAKTYREYIYYKNYGRIFVSMDEYQVWKKQNKSYVKYIIKCIEYIFLITFFSNSIPIDMKIEENNYKNLYKINIFIMQLLSLILIAIIVVYIIFCIAMIFSYIFSSKKKNKNIKEMIDIKDIKIDNPNEECSICLEINDNAWIKIHCNHIYHKECLKEWIKISKSCPICREQL